MITGASEGISRELAVGPDGAPRRESPREEGEGTMPLDTCVRLIMQGIDRRSREIVMTRRARLGLWLKPLAPGLVDRIAERAI